MSTKIDADKLLRIVTEFRGGFLKDGSSKAMCFALSAALAGYLDFCGYKCELTQGGVGDWEHWWITLPDGEIIDPTAGQFKDPSGKSMPDIYFGVKPSWYELPKEALL